MTKRQLLWQCANAIAAGVLVNTALTLLTMQRHEVPWLAYIGTAVLSTALIVLNVQLYRKGKS